MEPATSILVNRAREVDGLGRMCAYSLLAHGLLVAGLSFAPSGAPRADETERIVMTVTTGLPEGPKSGGMTAMGQRAVQEVAPPAARPEPLRPPAPRVPEMIAPAPKAKPAPPQAKPVPPRPSQSTARTQKPSTGPAVQPGTAVADTGVKGMGFGLSTGGGGTGGYLDVGNFCCPEYLGTMNQLIHRNWNSKQGISAEAWVKFTIQRDGQITNVELEKSSGYTALDLTAQRALLLTRQLPPLPAAFTEAKLTVHLKFQYQP